MKNYRIIKGKKIHVNQLASMSHKYTVKNTKKGISPVVDHKCICGDIPKDKLITNPLTSNQFVMTNPHYISGNYGVTVTGYDWIPINEYKANNGLLWEHKKYPQPKNFWNEIIDGKPTLIKSTSLHKDPVKMNRVQYMEKLVEHKTAKWERKNPYPVYSPDLFYSQEEFNKDVEKWKQLHETAKERFRDFVVSIYDPLPLTGRFVIAKEGSATYIEEKVAEIKDISEGGHRINEIPKDHKLIKKAQKVTNETKAKRKNLIATNLKDHKRQKGRIILPEAA